MKLPWLADVLRSEGCQVLETPGWLERAATGKLAPIGVLWHNLEASWQLVSRTPDDQAVRSGLFGPVIAVPADAPLLDRVIGAAGRDPHWST